jgi:hypothetical protein
MIQIFSVARDEVIKSSVSIGQCTYAYAIQNFVPLLNRFGEQRKIQSKNFYARLRSDILQGCVIPPITLAFDNKDNSENLNINNICEFIRDNIADGYILDGMQRLNTLLDASNDDNFNENMIVPVNVIIAQKYDLLLYRMITLNNGQKPMTARHQIEMLTRGLINKSNLEIIIMTEKETEGGNPRGAFRQSDISEAYIAYMSNSLHNQNNRIIESKLDEILVGKVMESNLTDEKIDFQQVLQRVSDLSQNQDVKDWLRLGNNLIGFCVGAKQSFDYLLGMDANAFAAGLKKFETAFASLETSKVNVGKVRRDWAKHYIGNIANLAEADQDQVDSAFVELTMID